MPTFSADPNNFGEFLTIVKDGYEIALTAGEYKGPFTIQKAIVLRGEGENTIIFATDEPVLKIAVPGVKLENLSIERNVGGNTGEVAIEAAPHTAPVLDRVRCLGSAPNVQWLGVSWDIPTAVDFGEIQTNRYLQRTEQLQLGGDCKVSCSAPWLQVQQPYLSCGLQKLDIVLNSQDIPAGTNLSGSIVLQASSHNVSIKISAIITAPQTSNNPSPLSSQTATEPVNNNDENWGYRFLGNQAIDYLIREMEGKDALEKYPEFSDRRDRAEDLLSDILGDEPRLFYVRRKEPGEAPGEEKWELAIATDIETVKLPEILEKRQKTLSLVALVTEGRSDGLRLLSARLVASERGRSDGFSVLFSLSLHLNHQSRRPVPTSALNLMQTVPFCGDCVPTEEQLKGWRAFLKIEERIAKTREFFVAFSGHNYGSATRKITFEVTASLAQLDKSSGIYLKQDDFWTRAAKARNEDIKLVVRVEEIREQDDRTSERESVPQPAKWQAILLGSIEEIDKAKGFIRVRLDSELVEKIGEGNYQLPKTGFLSFEAAGDLTQIKRQKKALDDLQMGIAQNPYVGEFFFDASQARNPQTTVKLKPEDLLLSGANDDQVAAVEAVLSAPDLVLIQGPPGTGKTTVIAEISYQVALRGGRTLIASQANLAVDNALSRLIHSPVIRALRKGRAERVEEEGLPFVEDKVIGNWLRNTADDCEKRLAKQREDIEFFNNLLAGSTRFDGYLQAEEKLQESYKELRSRKTELEETCRNQESVYQQAEAKQREIVEYILPGLELLMSQSSINWEDVAVINLFESLKPYIILEESVRGFKAKIKEIVKLTSELGLVPPQRETFGLAAWLQDNLSGWIDDALIVLSYGNDALLAMFEAKSVIQTVEEIKRYGNQQQIDSYHSQADMKFEKSIALWKNFAQFPEVPENLRILAESIQTPSDMLALAPEIAENVRSWENRISQIETGISAINIVGVLSNIREITIRNSSNRKSGVKVAKRNLSKSKSQLREIDAQQQLPPTLISERNWWESAWQNIPDRLKPPIPDSGLYDLNFLHEIKTQFDAWDQQLTQEESHLKGYENLTQDWIAKLRNPSEQDQSELRQVYIENANVIGITCSQVAGYGFKEFTNFDVVIIDEVSKCTPPEILIPALKGKKLVLIGDYRQLPPMLHEKSLEEIATEMGIEPEDISFLEESLFKKQFEAASESIKRRLTVQYRMHPYIMGAINQFYDHSLRCGIMEPEKVRSHNVAGDIIRAEHHLIWVKMPQEQRFQEQLEGTSRYNLKEVEAIDILCEQMEDVWSLKVAEGQPKKEIGIITFYGAQLRRIEEMLSDRKFPSLAIRTGTVDRFQGMERPIIIVSMVRNNPDGDIGFAKKPERVNVAFSRAQELLIIVGCHSLFTKHKGKVGSMYSEVANIVRRNGGLIDVSSVLG
ncbi:MAG: AAA domain-containing protein [Microcoleus sp.]